MSISQWLFAAGYDALDATVQRPVRPYRKETAGRARGETLEIGAGTGSNLPFYPHDVRLTALEPNPHMVRRLTKKARRLGREVTVVEESGEHVPFPDGSFDSVVTTLVLCMVDDLETVVSEARRVLRPGGQFLFYEHVVSPGGPKRWFQNRLNPLWRFATTGCNLNRDIAKAIASAGFDRSDFEAFDLSVGIPVTLPNIVGRAIA